MTLWFVRIVSWVLVTSYAYGALVHVQNILGLNGFDWADAPLKWRVLDITYLVLDMTVVVGLMTGLLLGYVAFFVAATSQILLYTVFRKWIVHVPGKFVRSPEEITYLDGLVAFHIVTILLVCLAIWLKRRAAAPNSD